MSIQALVLSEYSSAQLAALEADAAAWISANNSSAVKTANASRTYNCHAYAFHISDGGSAYWINNTVNGGTNVAYCWAGSSPTYVSTTAAEGTKVYYYGGDHTATISTTHTGQYESKWGSWPRYRHAVHDSPYNDGSLQYKKVNLYAPSGGGDLICVSSTKTYATLSISGAGYSWSGVNLAISGSSNSIVATGSSNGQGKITANISSPYSGTTIKAIANPWIGTPAITNKRVNGNPYYESGAYICPGNHYLNVTPKGTSSAASWTVPSGIPYYVSGNELDFTLYSSGPSSLSITAKASNVCGQGANSSFYLMKQSWGCSSFYSVVVYPNPTSDELFIEAVPTGDEPEENFEELVAFEEISIIDEKGKVYLNKKEKGNRTSIITRGIPKGHYFLKIRNGESEITEQIIIE